MVQQLVIYFSILSSRYFTVIALSNKCSHTQNVTISHFTYVSHLKTFIYKQNLQEILLISDICSYLGLMTLRDRRSH